MKAVVFTLGCKVNDVESGSIIRGLKDLGWEVSRELGYADLYVVNTCAVTAEAERKSRQTIARALKFNPSARVIVCGCATQKSEQDFLDKGEQVFAVLGARNKKRVLEIVESQFSDEFCGGQVSDEQVPYENLPVPECLKTRNFVKIQDGCNRFCSYCVIPFLRGRSRSRDADDAAEEILQSGALETVVTGIDISAYQDEKGRDICDLLALVKDANTRIRLGSMEVSMITPKFLQTLKGLKNFAPQFHLSLQSGSNSVLKSMNRHYTREEYLQKCQMIYEVFPNAGITTDIIVGFPTETEEDFLQSLAIVKEAGFSQIHAFPYSPREGTNAYKRYKELPSAVKKQRVERILEEGEKQKTAYLEKCIGKTFFIVPEREIDGVVEGYAENYIRVYGKGKCEKRLTQVCVEQVYKDGVWAKILREGE